MATKKTFCIHFLRLIIFLNISDIVAGVSNQQNKNSIRIKQSGFQLSANEIDPNVGPIASDINVADLDSTILDPVNELEETNPLNTDDANPINKFCKCKQMTCNCCRDFLLPFVPVRGPACAKINYLGEEKMTITIKYGDITLVSRTVSGQNSQPICMPMPGGFSRFCGRIYGLSRGKEDFKACLGLELRAEDDVEAALRVSCFKFGSKGLAVVDAEPLPPVNEKNEEEEDEDGFLDFGGDDDADEDSEEDEDASDGDDGQTDFRWFQYIWK